MHISLRARSKRITELLLRNPRNSRLLYRPNKDGETPYSIDAYHQKQILSLIHGHSKISFYYSNSWFSLDPLKKANVRVELPQYKSMIITLLNHLNAYL